MIAGMGKSTDDETVCRQYSTVIEALIGKMHEEAGNGFYDEQNEYLESSKVTAKLRIWWSTISPSQDPPIDAVLISIGRLAHEEWRKETDALSSAAGFNKEASARRTSKA
jgi:hypothetical protein